MTVQEVGRLQACPTSVTSALRDPRVNNDGNDNDSSNNDDSGNNNDSNAINVDADAINDAAIMTMPFR